VLASDNRKPSSAAEQTSKEENREECDLQAAILDSHQHEGKGLSCSLKQDGPSSTEQELAFFEQHSKKAGEQALDSSGTSKN
jgi:hypothetical protein